jgi:ParB family chromosome partitioning protein
MDEDMDILVESVKSYGIIAPVILRKKEDGRFECAAGHRRRKAAELAGHTTIRAEVKELTQDEAIILMVDSNLQRTTILPSEKAFSYKMRLEAMKRQGKRNDLTSGPMVQKWAREELADLANENGRQIARYIRLTNLVPALLDMVDEGRIAFRPAVELSYLSEQEQRDLLETISYEDATPSLSQAIKMKEFSKAGRLNADVILSIMCERKPNQVEKIVFRSDRLKPYLPKNISPKQTEEYILKALEYYQRYRERMKERGDR